MWCEFKIKLICIACRMPLLKFIGIWLQFQLIFRGYHLSSICKFCKYLLRINVSHSFDSGSYEKQNNSILVSKIVENRYTCQVRVEKNCLKSTTKKSFSHWFSIDSRVNRSAIYISCTHFMCVRDFNHLECHKSYKISIAHRLFRSACDLRAFDIDLKYRWYV